MKISNSKKQLAKIIHENGGWREGASFASQGRKTGAIGFVRTRPRRSGDVWQTVESALVAVIHPDVLIPNWHQTILSRREYFHLYPEPDADGWIEWNGGDIDIDDMQLVDYKMACTPDGKYRTSLSMNLFWDKVGEPQDIIAYRLHKPEQAKTEPVAEAKPTFEQLAADYRNKLDYANRKQEEADAAKADAEAKLAELVAAGKAIGLALNVACVEPELVITDWRDLRVGDIIEYVDGRNKDRVGMVGRINGFDLYNTDTDRPVRMVSDDGQVGWPTKWRFIRRP